MIDCPDCGVECVGYYALAHHMVSEHFVEQKLGRPACWCGHPFEHTHAIVCRQKLAQHLEEVGDVFVHYAISILQNSANKRS